MSSAGKSEHVILNRCIKCSTIRKYSIAVEQYL